MVCSQIFDGYSEESGQLFINNWPRVVDPLIGTVDGSSFQVVVVLSVATGSNVSWIATYQAVRKCSGHR